MNVPKSRWLVAIAFLCLAIPIWSANPDAATAIRRFGLFVGANNGGNGRTKLQWAVSDVQRISQVMTELGGMIDRDVIILTDPSLPDIQQAISRMKTEVNKAQVDSRRVEFMFYYSGHSDEEGLLLGNERLVYRQLRQAITDVKADVSIAVLDSCASGAFTREKGGVRIQPFLVDGSSDMKGYAFLTSSSENESAQESDRLGASFFTYYLVSALRGAANTGNNRVTLNEAYKYAFDETLARTESTTSGPQHPSYDIKLSGSGDLVLSDLTQPSAALLLKEDLEGRVSIRDQKGYLVMEINKTATKALLVALQPGNYTLRIETNGAVYSAPARLALHQQAQISKFDFQRSALVANRTRGVTVVPESEIQATSEPTSPAADENPNRVLDIARSRYRDAERNRDAEASRPALADAKINQPKLPVADFLQGIGTWLTESIGAGTEQPAYATDSQASADPDPGKIQDNPEPAARDNLTNPDPPKKVIFHFGLWPGLSSAGRSRNVESIISLSPLINSVAKNEGAMLSSLINLDDGKEAGYQGAGLLNTCADLLGVQTAGIGNINTGPTLGVQAAGIFNIGIGSMRGTQLSGLFNIAGITVEGVQAAGLFNIGSERVSGVQIGGLFNKAKAFSGVQIAGLVNIADQAGGVQIAPVNIAKHMDGLPIGVVNVILDGIHDLSVWTGGDDRLYLGLLNGSKNFYSIFFAGMYQQSIGKDYGGFVLGYGVGTRLRLVGPLYLDIEANIKHASIGTTDTQRFDSLFRTAPGENTAAEGIRLVPAMRLVAGVDLKYFKGFAGLNLDIFTPAFMTPKAFYGHEPNYAGKLNLGSLPVILNPQIIFGISLSI